MNAIDQDAAAGDVARAVAVDRPVGAVVEFTSASDAPSNAIGAADGAVCAASIVSVLLVTWTLLMPLSN